MNEYNLERIIYIFKNIQNILLKVPNIISKFYVADKLLVKVNKSKNFKNSNNISFFYNYLIITTVLEPILSILLYLPSKLLLFENKYNTYFYHKQRLEDYSPQIINKLKEMDISSYFAYSGLYIQKNHNILLVNNKLSFPEKSILSYYPHNICAYGFVFNGILSPHFDTNISWLVSTFLSTETLYPFSKSLKRELKVENIKEIKQIMSRGQNISLVPGGFYDASLTEKNTISCYISIGSIKYSIDYDYNYIPLLTVGEENFYNNLFKLNKSLNLTKPEENILHKFNIPTVLPLEKLGISGSEKKLITLVGVPIRCGNKNILEVQNEIYNQLVNLYVLSKEYFGITSQLKIICEKINVTN